MLLVAPMSQFWGDLWRDEIIRNWLVQSLKADESKLISKKFVLDFEVKGDGEAKDQVENTVQLILQQ